MQTAGRAAAAGITERGHAEMHAGSAQITQALNDLRLHWDEAYKITYHPGAAESFHAERLDDGTVLTADSPWALRDKIIGDYSARPVPRMANAEDRPDAC